MRKVYVFFGKPAAGKNYIGEQLESMFGFVLIDMGTLIRSEIAKAADSKRSGAIEGTMNKGELISDETVERLLRAELTAQEAALDRGLILIGYPRRMSQLAGFQSLANDFAFDEIVYLYLHVEDSFAIEKAQDRIEFAKKKGETPRKDDLIVEKRLDVFARETLPLIMRLTSEPGYKQLDIDSYDGVLDRALSLLGLD